MNIYWTLPGRSMLFAALTGVALFGALACSGDDDDASGATAAATDTPSAADAPQATATQAPEATATEAPAGDTPEASAVEPLSVTVGEGDIGPYLVGPEGLTLYVFTRDDPDTVNCTEGCLQTWPPLLLEEGQEVEGGPAAPGTFGSVDTPSGIQVTYDGAPLYYFAADAQPGDVNGHLVGNVWFVARPETASTSVVGVAVDGSYLVGPTGMTLYLFANDSEGVSNCSGGCLENWPALTVPEDMEPSAVSEASGALDTITRDDGAVQVTYDGLPLYYYVGDQLPGDTTGDGVGGVWSLATP